MNNLAAGIATSHNPALHETQKNSINNSLHTISENRRSSSLHKKPDHKSGAEERGYSSLVSGPHSSQVDKRERGRSAHLLTTTTDLKSDDLVTY
jgi:hypothetical protein